MLCQDVMKRPVEMLHPGESVQAAAQRMRDANIGFLPVCDREGHTLGVVTDRDIAVRLCAVGGAPGDTPVETIMTADVVHCSTNDDLRVAEQLMVSERKSRIVVTDARGRLAGIISLSDVAACAPADAVQVLQQVAAREILGPHGTRPAAS